MSGGASALYAFVDLFRRQVAATEHVLTRGLEHARERGVAESDLLGWRLAPDMHPLAFQVRIVADYARQWSQRAAGLPVDPDTPTDADAHGLLAALARSREALAAMTPDTFAGRDDRPLTHILGTGQELTLPLLRWLGVFVATNIGFHLSITYAILRANGVPLGKRDLFPEAS